MSLKLTFKQLKNSWNYEITFNLQTLSKLKYFGVAFSYWSDQIDEDFKTLQGKGSQAQRWTC